ncbi:MAG: hypothetical protein HKN29_07425, partial [Rhodothermales bacterium]|nr:hypothetical protein [Rhodothermales bacterium]
VLHTLPYAHKDPAVAIPPDTRLVGTPAQMYKDFRMDARPGVLRSDD